MLPHQVNTYHWFPRSKIEDPGDYTGSIKILPIDTSLQVVDTFTKGLGEGEFQKKRGVLLMMGW